MHYDKLQGYLCEMGVDSLYYLALDADGNTVVREHKNAVQDVFWENIKQ
jgi:hypothetical protein